MSSNRANIYFNERKSNKFSEINKDIKYIINKNPNDPIYARIQEQVLFIERSKLYQRRLKQNKKSI